MANPSCNETISTPQKRHRILCLQHSSLFEAYGGIEYYLDDLLSLATEAYGPGNVFTMVPERKSLQLAPRPYDVEVVPFAKSSLLQRVENRVSPRFLAAAIAAVKRHRPSLILNAHVSLGPLAFAVSRTTGVPYVSIVYGIESWGDLWPQDEWALARSKGVLSISRWTKQILQDRGYPSELIQILHPGLAPDYTMEQFTPKGTSGTLTLLSISRLDASEQYKGQDHVLQALSRLRAAHPEVKLRFIIQGSGSDLSRLKEMVKTLDLEKMVEFRAPVSDRQQLKSLYEEADLYVMPSRFGFWDKRWRGEGFGIVYVEAAAFGLPSVAYNCGGATDIIVSGETGILVEPDNIDALGQAIVSFALDRGKLRAMGEKAHERALTHFTKAPLLNEFVEAFDHF